jgi:dihydropyrimidinase
MAVLIRSGILVNAADSYQADILLDGEKIIQIGVDLPITPQLQVIDASRKLILPGGIDVHTHFNLPMFGTVSSDDHYTGHKAAAFGGTTTVIDFVPQDFASLNANLDAWHLRADALAAIDFSFHMNISHFDQKVAGEIPNLIQEGITSIKVFTAYNNRMRLEDKDIFQVMRIAARYGILTMLHAENGDVIDILTQEAVAAGHTSPIWHARTRPAWGAVEAVLRASALAAQADAPLYVVHMNAAGEVDQLEYARQKGVKVMGETCPQYLFFTEDDLNKPDGAKYVCSPPLRTPRDHQRLWEGIKNASIQVIGTDHCPFFFNGQKPIEYEGKQVAIPGKELGSQDFTKIPNGLPGVADRLPVLWSRGVKVGRITPNQFVALNCTNPAKIFGLYPQKGVLAPGSDADIVIWNDESPIKYGAQKTHHRTDYNLYEGWELSGFPETVFLRGKMIVNGQMWKGKAGEGRFLRRGVGAVL